MKRYSSSFMKDCFETLCSYVLCICVAMHMHAANECRNFQTEMKS